MPDKDLQEILDLIKKIDSLLRTMRIEIAQDKIRAARRRDHRSAKDIIYNIIILMLQIYIVYAGYIYIKSTSEDIPPTAVIGAIGISFILLNSISNSIKNFYLYFKIRGKYKKTLSSLSDIKRHLGHIDEIMDLEAQVNERYIELDQILEDVLEKLNRSLDEINSKGEKKSFGELIVSDNISVRLDP